MTTVVISQPMLFPWVGLFEQIRLADVYVHYDDVQFSRGFFNRVQVKTARGSKWLTAPLRNLHQAQLIREVQLDERRDWRAAHAALLKQSYAAAPFVGEMLALAGEVYAAPAANLAELGIHSIERVCRYFGLLPRDGFLLSSDLRIAGRGSERILAIVKHLGADTYITGHGARHYLDHEAFERAGVKVEYMEYQKRHYPQLHGEFTPFVTILDLIANVGVAGRAYIVSGTVGWREFGVAQ